MWNGTVRYGTRSKLTINFEPEKLVVFYNNISLEPQTKSGTIFGHFAWTVVNEMKRKGILCSKGPIFSLNPTNQPFWINFEEKCTETLSEVDNTLQKVARFYNLVHNPTIINSIP